ncbi:tRNA 2-thiouridine(34) synthase MnmA [bacterium]|jgi:tRNA-5-taurinomethyluridine 2-sulfurtransferase|nr:tRNA 2-thiouridine(34) synthase MnmA [bacterium]
MKVAVLVSGGVDSSVALRLLKDQGHEVTAYYLKIWLEEDLSFLASCPWEEDLEYTQALCEQLDVPLEIVSMQTQYRNNIVAYVIDEAKSGRTPNPDVLCNQFIKFGLFFDKIDKSFEKVATGHYAQVKEVDGIFHLYQSPDPIKDQAYFLSRLDQKQLSRSLFPVGHFTKEQVRELAKKYDLPAQSRKDSQGICFLGKIKFDEFLRHHLGEKIGDIVEYETGSVIGKHQGFWFYTIGQRKGIGLSGGPWYVVVKDSEKNLIYISKSYYEKDKKRDELLVGNLHWITGIQPVQKELGVKLRHGPEINKCFVDYRGDKLSVRLQGQDQGIAAGQFAVFYLENECLGSGMIL